MLSQVQDPLERIKNGAFGNCLADGEPIDEKRLEAVPWTPYCLHISNNSKSRSRAANGNPVRLLSSCRMMPAEDHAILQVEDGSLSRGRKALGAKSGI
jgi:Prokaryotic dksA/traR C4-type zinc finger